MTVNLADQRSVQKRDKRLKQEQLIADEGLKVILASDNATTYLAALVRESQVLLPVVAASEQGAMFRDGRKILGLKIMSDVQRVAPKQFPALIASVLEQPNDGQPKEEDDHGRPDGDQ